MKNLNHPGVSTPMKFAELSRAQSLQLYLVAAVIAHYACLSFNGHSSDLGYWFDWANQLDRNGYRSLNANYPPLYVHWIFVTTKIMALLGVALENNLLFKTLLQLPVLLCHIILIAIVNSLISKSTASITQQHGILLLTAVNPAILFNGPIWGQVDLIPTTFALGALAIYFSKRYCALSIPLYTLAILTKFQMICLAPVMGILFFRNLKAACWGICISIILIAIAFFPFIKHGEFLRYFKQAYINTLGEYAYTTFNAANLWVLITGNVTPDHQTMFTLFQHTTLEKPVSAKLLGMLLFAMISLFIFSKGVLTQWQHKCGDRLTQESATLFYSLFCAIAFFTLLPAMHERYLFPAVCIALAYCAKNPGRIIYAIAISAICFVNMAIVHGINGSDIWVGLSCLTLTLFVFIFIEFLAGRSFFIFLSDVFTKIIRIKWLAFWVFTLMTVESLVQLVERYSATAAGVAKNEQRLSDITPVSTVQTHGTLQINRSYDGRMLSVGNRRYLNGLGTHAHSTIVYRLAPGAKSFRFIVGVDDEVGTAEMRFSVWGDDKKLWESDMFYGHETANTQHVINVDQITLLSLRVDGFSDLNFDHADWINPIITFDHDLDQQ